MKQDPPSCRDKQLYSSINYQYDTGDQISFTQLHFLNLFRGGGGGWNETVRSICWRETGKDGYKSGLDLSSCFKEWEILTFDQVYHDKEKELELSLLHRQQTRNVEIPETHLIIHVVRCEQVIYCFCFLSLLYST
jgi:hypothetical protein